MTRIRVPFCDHWADPGPDGASYDACLEALCAPLDRLAPQQRPAVLVWRYIVEMEQGGHARYFRAMQREAAAHLHATMEGLCYFGLFPAAEILSRALERGHQFNALAEPLSDTAFTDLDAEYATLGMADEADHPQTVFDRYLRANPDLFIELAPPGAEDEALLAMGNPALHRDGGRAAWRSLAHHPSPRVRLKAAEHLLALDRDTALQIARGVRVDPRANPWVLSKALTFLRRAGVSLEKP